MSGGQPKDKCNLPPTIITCPAGIIHSFIKFLKMLIHDKFVCFRLYTVNNFSVILGFLGLTSPTEISALLKDTTPGPRLESNPRPCDQGSNTPPCERFAVIKQGNFNMYGYGSKYGDTMANSEGPN